MSWPLFFRLCEAILLSCPHLIVNPRNAALLNQLTGFMIYCVRNVQNRDCVKHAMDFFGTLLDLTSSSTPSPLASPPLAQESYALINSCLAAHGQMFTETLLFGIADFFPSHLVSKTSTLLFSLIGRNCEKAREWIYHSLVNPKFPVKQLEPSDKERFLSITFNLVKNDTKEIRVKFRAFITLWSSICRGENDRDGLLAYEFKSTDRKKAKK